MNMTHPPIAPMFGQSGYMSLHVYKHCSSHWIDPLYNGPLVAFLHFTKYVLSDIRTVVTSVIQGCLLLPALGSGYEEHFLGTILFQYVSLLVQLLWEAICSGSLSLNWEI